MMWKEKLQFAPMGRFMAFLIVTTSCCGLIGSDRWAAADDTTKQLVAIWQGQASEIVTATIRYRKVSATHHHVRSLDAERVEQLFRDKGYLVDANQFQDLVSTLVATPFTSSPPWKKSILWHSDNMTREEVEYPGGLKQVHVDRGGIRVMAGSGNKQVDVTAGSGNQVMTNLAALRMIPQIESDDMTMRRNEGGVAVFDWKQSEFTVDVSTGFVNRAVSRDPASGEITSLGLQIDPVVYGGDIVFPRVVMRSSFQGGKLRYFEAIYIDEAVFNEPIAADRFTVIADAGTTVVDSRTSVDNPVVLGLDAPSGDVLATLNALRAAEKKPSTQGSYSFVVVGILLFCFAGIVALLLRIRSARRPRLS